MKGIVYIAQNRYYADPDGGLNIFKLGHTGGNSWADVERRWREGRGPATNYPGEVRPVFAVLVDDMNDVEDQMQQVLVAARIVGGGREWYRGNVESTKRMLLNFPGAQEVQRSKEVVAIEEEPEVTVPKSIAGWTLAEVGIQSGDILEFVGDDSAYVEGAQQDGKKATFLFRKEGHESDGERMTINTAASILDGYPTSGPARFRAPQRLQAKPTETLSQLIHRIRKEAK